MGVNPLDYFFKMKLKTLKDLEKVIVGWTYLDGTEVPQALEIIKTEAIKWVKKWELELKECYEKHFPLAAQHLLSKIDVFKHFFNITEEELK